MPYEKDILNLANQVGSAWATLGFLPRQAYTP